MTTASENRVRADGFRAVFASEGMFRAWYDRTLPAVYAFVLYRCGGNETAAMDITQEAFVEAVRTRERFDGRSSPLTWICGIARHKLADHFRRLERDDRRLQLIADRSGSADWEQDADLREDVLRSLRALPSSQGVVLALHYLDNLSVREIADQLGRSEKSIESLLSRGRESFRRTFVDRAEGASGG